MKPAPFDYVAPRTLAEALALLAEHGPDAKLLAGGQSLFPLLNMRLATPAVLIDLNHVVELLGAPPAGDLDHPLDTRHTTRDTPRLSLRLPALTRHRWVERSVEVARRCPLLAAALPFVAHPQIRNRGTIGGNVAHADPASEIPAVMAALDGSVVASGPAGAREIPWGAFFAGPLTTALDPDEILTEVRLPDQPAGSGSAFHEIARRRGDYALAAVAATVTLDSAGRVKAAGIGLAAAGPTPIKPVAAEASLIGRIPDDAACREAAVLAAAAADPESDVQAPAEYRRHLIDVLTRRALIDAAGRAAHPT